MSAKPVKVGIVGLGRWAKVLTRAAANSQEIEIVAGYSRSEEKRQAFQQELGVPSVPDMKTMLSNPEFHPHPVLSHSCRRGKFMSECRALTNVIGNGVAAIVVSRWEGELDVARMREAMAHPADNAEAQVD